MRKGYRRMLAVLQWIITKQQCLRLFSDRFFCATRMRLSNATIQIFVILATLVLPVGAIIALAGMPLVDEAYALFFGIKQDSGDADPDGDGLSNDEESLLWTDPWTADTDRDGWPDVLDGNPVSRAYIPWGNPRFTHGEYVIYTWPVWMDLVWSEGGFWITDEPFAWHSPSSQVPVSLNLAVDRSVIVSNMVLKLDIYDHAESSLYVDLFNTNLLVTVTNLYGNLLHGDEERYTLTMEIPFARHPDAVGVHLRKEQGSATIYGSQLYIDADLDGHDACQEAQIGTSDTGGASLVETFDKPVWPKAPAHLPYPALTLRRSSPMMSRSVPIH